MAWTGLQDSHEWRCTRRKIEKNGSYEGSGHPEMGPLGPLGISERFCLPHFCLGLVSSPASLVSGIGFSRRKFSRGKSRVARESGKRVVNGSKA